MTERLVVEMKELAEKYGARFLTVMLNGPEEIMAYYIERFKHHRIELVNCNFPLTDDMRVPGEGHPNDRMHTRWAQCIQQKLADRLSHASEGSCPLSRNFAGTDSTGC